MRVFPKTILKGFLACVALFLCLGGAILLVFWFSPLTLVRWASPFIPNKHQPHIQAMEGNPLSGYWVEGLTLNLSGSTLIIDRLEVELAWLELLQKRAFLKKLHIKNPHYVMRWGAPKNDSSSPKGGPTEWVVAVDDIQIENGVIEIKEGPAKVPGRIDDITIQARFQDNTLHLLSATATAEKSHLKAHGEMVFGTMAFDFVIEADGPIKGKVVSQGDLEKWTGSIDLDYLDMLFHGQGSLDQHKQWDLSLAVSGINPNDFNENIKKSAGPLSLKGTARGSGLDVETSEGHSSWTISRNQHPIAAVKLGKKKNGIKIDGSLFDKSLKGNVTGFLYPSTQSLQAQFHLRGHSRDLQVWVDLVSSNFDWTGSVSGPWVNPRFNTDLRVTDTFFKDIQLETGSVHVDGELASHSFQIDLGFPSTKWTGAGTGQWVSSQWTAQWESLKAKIFEEEWVSADPFKTVFGRANVELSQLNLTNKNGQLEFDGAYQNNKWARFHLHTRDFDLSYFQNKKWVKWPLGGKASLDINLWGAFPFPSGEMKVDIKQADINGEKIGDITAYANSRDRKILLENMTIDSPLGTLFLKGNLPLDSIQKRDPSFSVTVQALTFDWGPLLEGFSDLQVENAKGQGELTVSRFGGEFAANGALFISADHFRTDSQGVDLTNVGLDVVGEGPRLIIQKGSALSKKNGKVTLTGELNQRSPEVQLVASKMPFASVVGFAGKLDAQIKLNGSWEKPFLSGDVHLYDADYNPGKAKKKKNGEKTEGVRDPSPLGTDLHILIDKNVWYKDKQTSIELGGALLVRKEPYEPLRLLGSIKTLRGDYVFYGKVFNIERGNVNFTGEIPINPLLDINAHFSENVSKTKVNLITTGSLAEPKITLTSNPPMEESDILSVLATGRPLYELGNQNNNKGSTALAQNMVANYLAEGLRQQVQDYVDVDVLRVNVTDQQLADVTVGKRVTDDLFISYGETLGDVGERRIEAEYSLTDNWNLEGKTSSLGRYVVDLLFKYPLDRKKKGKNKK